VSEARFRLEQLTRRHNRAAFSCGVDELDFYVQRQARQDLDRKAAGVFVLHDNQTGLIAGYYTLNSTSVALADLPPSVAAKLPRYPYLGATLIGRLAVDRRYQSQGIGRRLLFDALRRAWHHSDEIGAVAVIVDAKNDDARTFYERYGFSKFPNRTNQLFLPIMNAFKLGPDSA
jgi:GNAT superfamily N-acetyltransferase